MISVKCNICGSDSFFALNKDNFDLYRCSNCDLFFVYPQPTEDFLRKEVYSDKSGFQSNRAENLQKIKKKKRYEKVIDYITSQKKFFNLLDVGSGGGHFMYWVKKRGGTPYGVELNKKTADSAISQGLKVFNGLLRESNYSKESFDFVFLGEIIEHVNDPRELIIDCKKFVKKDGILIITTPNANCLWSKLTFLFYRLFKIPWSTATPPYHLFQFNNINLDLLLHQEGFINIYSYYLLPPNIKYELGSLHLLSRYKKTRKLFDLIFMVFSFSLYVTSYIINFLLHPFIKRDFSMIKAYKIKN